MLRSPRAALCLVPALLAIASVAHADDPPPLPASTASQPPPGYGQPPPGYGQPPPGYGQPPPGYGQAPPGYGQPPPGYYPPPGYGQPYYPPPQPQDTRPRILDYEEDQPIPEGYHLKTTVRRGLIGGGAGLLGGMWLLSTLVGAIANAGHNRPIGDGRTDLWTPMYVPLVGPFITIGTASDDLGGDGTALLAIDGIAQLGGAAMIVLGIVLPKKQLIRDASFSPVPGLTVQPTFGFGNAGLSGTF